MDKTEANNSTRASRDASEKHQMILNNVYKLLECPVCTTLMSSPIHQCLNGHTLCSICKIRVKNCCQICGNDIGSIRCLALEKVAEPLKLPYPCPYAHSECSVTGNNVRLVTHLKADHNVSTHNGFKFNHCYVQSHSHETQNATGMITVIRCYERDFYYYFEPLNLGKVPCYIAILRFLGEDFEAKKFCYSIDIGGNGRKLTWQGAPRSIRDSYQKGLDNLDGLLFPRKLAIFFSDGKKQELELLLDVRIGIEI